MTVKITLERRQVSSLIPHPGNTKLHTEAQVQKIALSIQRFGFNDPVACTPDGVLVEGEGRVQAAQLLGLEVIPVLVLEGLSEREADLYRIAHNKIALSTGFDTVALVAALRELVQGDITLSTLGFDEGAVSLMAVNEMLNPGANPLPADQQSAASADYILIWDNAQQKREFDALMSSARQPGEGQSATLLRVMATAIQTVNQGQTHDDQQLAV